MDKSFLGKVKHHLTHGSFFRTAACAVLFRVDTWVFAKFLSFKKYYFLQKRLGFPVEKLRFRQVHGYYPNHKNPRSFNEKCNYLKLYSRNPILPIIIDRVKVREYVAKKVGKEVLVPLIQVAESPEEINFDKLPNQFVIKTNFASGQNIIVRDKSQINIKEVKDRLTHWMNMKYRVKELIWFAQEVERKITIEKLLTHSDNKLPADYKFYVFNGEVKFIQVVEDRQINKKLTHFDKSWSFLDFEKGSSAFNKHIKQPASLPQMLKYAESLGGDFDFMRVDLYSVEDHVFFGELTPYPGNGMSSFNPTSYDFHYGECWKMDLKHLIN